MKDNYKRVLELINELNEENKEKPSKLRGQKKEKDIVPNSIEISNQFIIEGLKKDKNLKKKIMNVIVIVLKIVQ